MLTAREIIEKYISFFEKRGHKRIANAPLVPINDSTTLFTSSGMQALIPYLLGEPHQRGTRLVNVQSCLRAQDIDEVGNNRHTTFFRMMGNWSLGDYFKKEQLSWFFEFLTSETIGLGLDPNKLYVTVFGGDERFKVHHNQIKRNMEPDMESIAIWTKLFDEKGIEAKVANIGNRKPNIKDGRIFYYGVEKNWWSRAGTPEKMPAGEPGGPDSEVFYDYGSHLKIHENSSFRDDICHPNCDCGRFTEIGNSVFMQYLKNDDGTFNELPKKNVDFGGGLERLAAAVNDDPDVFKTDLYSDIIKTIEEYSNKNYEGSNKHSIRVIADHLKAATFLIINGVVPSNKEQGYILRRLLRRAAVKMHQLKGGLTPIPGFQAICDTVLLVEESIDQKINRQDYRDLVFEIIDNELSRFATSLDKGLRIFENFSDDQLNALNAFNLFQSYGFPFEISEELFSQKGKKLDVEQFNNALNSHKALSRTASSGMFKGGLADHSEKTVMGHTATHLLHQALRDVFGKQLHQTGSNITSDRIRFDFNHDRRLTDEEISKVEQIVNKKIKENLPVHFELIDTKEAHTMGAIGLFMDTYGDKSKIYFIGSQNPHPNPLPKGEGDQGRAYSIEFCGGPHVEFTGALKSIKIMKQENLGKNQKRLYAVVGV